MFLEEWGAISGRIFYGMGKYQYPLGVFLVKFLKYLIKHYNYSSRTFFLKNKH